MRISAGPIPAVLEVVPRCPVLPNPKIMGKASQRGLTMCSNEEETPQRCAGSASYACYHRRKLLSLEFFPLRDSGNVKYTRHHFVDQSGESSFDHSNRTDRRYPWICYPLVPAVWLVTRYGKECASLLLFRAE